MQLQNVMFFLKLLWCDLGPLIFHSLETGVGYLAITLLQAYWEILTRKELHVAKRYSDKHLHTKINKVERGDVMVSVMFSENFYKIWGN